MKSAGQCGDIEIIIFDFGGVLAEEGYANGLRAIAAKHGLNELDFSNLAHDLIHKTGYLTGHADERAYWQAIRNATGITESDDALHKEILSRFVLRPWMFELVKKIKSARIGVAVLSDQTDWLDELNRRDDFFKYFDAVYNSYHLGKSKVDPSLFSDIASYLKRSPEKLLFIDDTERHCERARRMGIRSIRYAYRDSFLRELERYCPFLFTSTD